MASPKKSEGVFKTSDGTKLFYETLFPSKPKALVFIVHGLAEHCGRYEDFANYLMKQGYAVAMYDQRGHGRSEGRRGFAKSIEQLADDLGEILHFISKKYPDLKIFLMGHSFGGQVSINYLAMNGKEVAGTILSAPNIRVAVPISPIKRWAGKVLQGIVPSLSLRNDLSAEWISHDKKIVEAYKNDKLVQHAITVKLGTALLDNVDRIQSLASKIKVPLLILHGGGDQITSPAGSKEFFENLKVKDRKFKIYPGFFHEILNETDKSQVYHDIAEWLDKRA